MPPPLFVGKETWDDARDNEDTHPEALARPENCQVTDFARSATVGEAIEVAHRYSA